MSTPCYIGVQWENETIEFIHCQYDGMPEGVGKILKKVYVDTYMAYNLLIARGNILHLGDRYITKTVFCCRDLREDWEHNKPQKAENLIDWYVGLLPNGLPKFGFPSYRYLFKVSEQKWYFYDAYGENIVQ